MQSAGVPFALLPAECTSGFGLHYDGDARQMTVDQIGPVWDAEAIRAAQVTTPWAHVAPLLRSDFTAGALAELAMSGIRVAYDGQGLVRVPSLGALQVDAAFDREVLAAVSLLKLADDEAAVLTAGAPFDGAAAASLGVPEIIVTAGSRGATLFVGGTQFVVPAAFRVDGVHTTGAGDAFTVAYVAARARGERPLEAAQLASQLVAELLAVRRELDA
jgi:sugar/nucleoside kinase (ribokinase family)